MSPVRAAAPDPLPVELSALGWKLEEPPAPELENYPACKTRNDVPGCALECMLPESGHKFASKMRKMGTTPMLSNMVSALARDVNRTRSCERCECQLCAICSKPANLYTSPTGQQIATVTTRTQPRFTFAYNPWDDDMSRMRKTLILEPTLTHAWHEATAKCCRETNGLVIDVGGNFGWYTLYSLALGCRVAVFEPVPAYREVMQLGLALNPGFAARTKLYGNVVYDQPGNYTLRVPYPRKGGRKLRKLGARARTPADPARACMRVRRPARPAAMRARLARAWYTAQPRAAIAWCAGMTGMDGSVGILKADWKAESYRHTASSVRIDDLLSPKEEPNICMLKADVEGYEPQVLQTARRLLHRHRVPALQLELTRTPRKESRNQTCAAVKMLAHLADLGYDFRQVNNRIVDLPAPPVGSWSEGHRLWDALPMFPSRATEAAASRLNPALLPKRSSTLRNQAMQVRARSGQTPSARAVLARRLAPCCSRTSHARVHVRARTGGIPTGLPELLDQPDCAAPGGQEELRQGVQRRAMPSLAQPHVSSRGVSSGGNAVGSKTKSAERVGNIKSATSGTASVVDSGVVLCAQRTSKIVPVPSRRPHSAQGPRMHKPRGLDGLPD